MRIYIDTSVFGGYFDEEFAQWTKPFFESVKNGFTSPIIFDLTINEIEGAPLQVKKLFEELFSRFEIISIDEEMYSLAALYIKEKAVTLKSYDDAVHIATAKIIKADMIVSWNFKHIVNVNRIRAYNRINLKYGYSMIDIRTPFEFQN